MQAVERVVMLPGQHKLQKLEIEEKELDIALKQSQVADLSKGHKRDRQREGRSATRATRTKSKLREQVTTSTARSLCAERNQHTDSP